MTFTATPARTPTPTPRPTKTPKPCPVYKFTIGTDGNGTIFNQSAGDLHLTSFGSKLSCLKDIINDAKRSAGSGADYDNDIAYYINRRLGGGYLGHLGPPKGGCFDSSCNPKECDLRGDNMCDAGSFHYNVSPISLLWQDGHTIGSTTSFTQFPLEPGQPRRSYRWYASAEAPLLVWDPQHRGEIRDGTQLFGNWTFGGQRTAAGDMGVAGSLQTKWNDGYEALATLDLNRDGEISGTELSHLGLWFDGNRDGVSQKGEVKTLAEARVTKLFYSSDRTDARGHIHASRGFERVVDGKTVIGRSVDWFAEGEDHSFTLINKLITEPSICGTDATKIDSETIDFTALENPGSEPPLLPELPAEGAKYEGPVINGIWEWHVEDPSKLFDSMEPQGYLFFKENESGAIEGRSYVETPLKPEAEYKSILSTFALQGRRTGSRSFAFSINAHEETKTVVNTIVKLEGDSLHGTSSVSQLQNGEPVHYSYSWVARRP